MDLTGQKTQKIKEFMNNTGTDKGEALDILNRNKWSLETSYKEIEQLCITEAQNKTRNLNQNKKLPVSTTVTQLPCQQAIDMGRGAAINLNHAHQSFSNNAQQIPHELSVQLPQVKNEYFISSHDLGSGNSGRDPGLDRDSASSGSGRFAMPQNQVPSSSTTNAHHHHQLPAAHLSPVKTFIKDKDPREEEDVFDDNKVFKRPPPVSGPRLKRGFSNILENESIVFEARHNVQTDIQTDSHDNMYIQTFVLPSLSVYNEDFRTFLEKDLIETSTLVSLEQAGRLNWWAELHLCQRLLPMATSGDGNCLLHAASLAMWGIHDRQLVLRKELHETLTKASYSAALYRRWRYQQMQVNKESGLVFSEAEWSEEWDNILRLASPRPRGTHDPARSNNCCDSPVTKGNEESVVYESLEEFHVFVLAHVLQRPIIVVADTILKDSSGEALAPIPFPGVYLPIEVPSQCFRSPLLLTYDAAHFSALCPSETEPSNGFFNLPDCIPLVDPNLQLLPLHFHIDPGPEVNWSKNLVFQRSINDKINLLQRFMEVDTIPLRSPDFNNGDSDHSSFGSQESQDENGSLTRDGKLKDKKKDARMSNQMHSVAKQFGSIGKSMGKKLKQLGKSGKTEKRPSVGSEISQCTKIITAFGSSNGGHSDMALVAKLSKKRTSNHYKMINNYLEDAKERFKQDQDLRKRNEVELRSKISAPSLKCANPDCFAYSSAESSYLCNSCFTKQQRDHNQQRGVSQSGGSVYNTFPGRSRQPIGGNYLAPSDEVLLCGNSKFYTASNEDIHSTLNENVNSNYNMNRSCNAMNQPSLHRHTIENVTQERCPSPDYDNINTDSHRDQVPVQRHSDAQCRNSHCNFFGRAEWSGFCSKCHHASRPTVVQYSTNL